ncbi:50S ribosomal protein L23 [Borrelia recurrentis]|uniref:Large ribosomal subunit protein uL23 n=1 Tax=Borrelia recurrentis (strain A1) TaxID=412418 RepID=B5RPI4_BORRA|nr:50S ribosomal protein L23 [Borrelia recurrentis]ACH94718.1 50S ribosomal protein L23 [Borrelia recurrentis A1]
MKVYDIIISPMLTEKTNIQRENMNVYAFKVKKQANKKEIGAAIKELFNVTPISCNLLNVKSKVKTVVSRKGYPIGRGKTSSWKKAYVYLKKEDKIDIF